MKYFRTVSHGSSGKRFSLVFDLKRATAILVGFVVAREMIAVQQELVQAFRTETESHGGNQPFQPQFEAGQEGEFQSTDLDRDYTIKRRELEKDILKILLIPPRYRPFHAMGHLESLG